MRRPLAARALRAPWPGLSRPRRSEAQWVSPSWPGAFSKIAALPFREALRGSMEPFNVDNEVARTVQQLRAVIPQGAPSTQHCAMLPRPMRTRRTHRRAPCVVARPAAQPMRACTRLARPCVAAKPPRCAVRAALISIALRARRRAWPSGGLRRRPPAAHHVCLARAWRRRVAERSRARRGVGIGRGVGRRLAACLAARLGAARHPRHLRAGPAAERGASRRRRRCPGRRGEPEQRPSSVNQRSARASQG